MIDINKIIDEILLEHSLRYPIPSLKEKEQVEYLIQCVNKLGYGKYSSVIKEIFLKEETPQKPSTSKDDKEGESKEFPGKFHLGAGYYSSKKDGEAEFKNDNGTLRPITPEEKAEFDKKNGKTPEDKPEDAPESKPEDKPTDAEKPTEPKDKPKPAAAGTPPMQTTPAPQTPEDKQKEDDIKNNPEKILNDPNASSKDLARASFSKVKSDNLKRKQKDDPEYQSKLKKDVAEKNNQLVNDFREIESNDGKLDAEVTENGSILIGVEHGEENESTKQIIDKIKTLPKDAKVVFVGEGGVGLDDNGKVDFVGEQAEIRDAFLDHFENGREESWDENSDVRNSDAPIFDEIAKSFGGDKEKALASVWTNMVSQGDDLDEEDYLTDETKEWIKTEAKKGGSEEFDGDVDWNNLSLEQKEDLFQLNYRDDQNYGETELSKGQKAYNDFRQKELDRKIKEAEEKGFTVIATMGNSHVGMWRERNKKKADTFKPQSLRNLQKELPDVDKDVFNKESDIDKIPSDKKEEISMKIDELADKASKGEDFNLCQITVPGTNLYCDDNQGIPREEMPQFKGKPLPGTPAADMPKDSKGEVDTEPLFKKMLKDKGIKTVETEVPSDKLKATQSELVGSKVAGMTKALEEDPNNPGITAPIYVSRDGFVIDGHHRWAAVTSNAIKAGKPANMKVIVVDMDIKDAIPMCNKFAEEQGIAAKKADANDGNSPKPSEPTKREPANDDPESKAQQFKGKSSGENIQTMEIEGGGFVYGTKHRNTAMVDDILDDVKSKIPKERWKDIVFVGEGGATNDAGELEFHDEMKYAVPKFKEIGAEIDTWDGDELDVHDDQSKLYKRQKEKTGFNDSQVKAGNWASMIGQGEGIDTMAPADYLDDEGKQFLQDAAKEAGLPPIENFDNPTGEKPSEENGWKGSGDKGTLYRLSFPEDNGDKETKINDIQVAFNDTRDENLIEKSKELAAKGKIPITIAGESHVDLVDKMSRKGKENPEETPTENLPKPKEPNKKEGGVIYPIGGNYYSDTPNGPAQYIKSESVVREIFENENEKFLSLLFEKTVTKKLPSGDTVRVTPIDVKDQPNATQKADAEDSKEGSGNVTPVNGDWKNTALSQMGKEKYKDSILDDNLKESISTIIDKMMKGEDLSDEELAIAKDYIKIVKTDKMVKLYIASKKKGDWSQQGYIKVKIGGGINSKKWADEASAKYGVTSGASSQGIFGKKQNSPAKLNDARKKAKIEEIDENTIMFNGKKMAKLPVLSFDEIKAQLKSENPNLEEKELNKKAAILERRIKRYNDNIDAFKEVIKEGGGEFEYVDFGDVDTPENRGKAIQSMVDIALQNFKTKLGDSANVPENKLVLDALESLKKFEGIDLETDENARKEYEQILSDLIVHMTNSKDFRDGVADFAEYKVAMELLGKGYPTYLPSDEAFKTADVLVVNSAELTDLADKSKALQLLYVTLEFSGGISVKYQGGGAGNSDEKVKKTRFKSNETRKRLNGMLGTYDSMYPNDRTPPNFPPSQEKLDELNATHEDNKKWAIENGIATEDEINKAEQWADKRIEAVLKTFASNGVMDCMNDDEKNRFKENMRSYYRNQKLMEVIYNNDADYTLFGNSNQKIKISKGKAVANESDIADGVQEICYMKIKDDVGFTYTKQGDCTVVKPSNRNPSEIHSHKPSIK